MLVGLGVAGCSFPEGEGSLQPDSPDQGIQATGRLDGSPIAISRGAPIVIVGDCDPQDGRDEDLCIEARTIDGLEVTLVVENRVALVPGRTVDIGRATCVDGCDTITDVVIARIDLGGDRSVEVTGGTIDVERADDRFVASFDLTLPFGDRLDGRFDVAERLPVQNPDGVLRPASDAETDGTSQDDG